MFSELKYHGAFYITDGESFAASYFGHPHMVITTMVETAQDKPIMDVFREVALDMGKNDWIRQAFFMAFKSLEYNPDKCQEVMVYYVRSTRSLKEDGLSGDRLTEASIDLIETFVKSHQ
jgi:hypothetical protein